MRIISFFGDYRFLSNFYPAEVVYHGLSFSSSEAAYQAAKCSNESDRVRFASYSPGEAKRQGQLVNIRPDWDMVKQDIMEEIVTAKFFQNPHLAEMLRATGDAELIEGNDWNDTYWGVNLATHEGYNFLGKILMRVRSKLNEKEENT